MSNKDSWWQENTSCRLDKDSWWKDCNCKESHTWNEDIHHSNLFHIKYWEGDVK